MTDFLSQVIQYEVFRLGCRKRNLGSGLHKFDLSKPNDRMHDFVYHTAKEISELARTEYESTLIAATFYKSSHWPETGFEEFYNSEFALPNYCCSKIERKLININNLFIETSKYSNVNVKIMDIHTPFAFNIYHSICFKDTFQSVFSFVLFNYERLLDI